MEECSQLNQSPSERRDHCITEHKFPHDFRFDCHSRTKKNNNNNNDIKTDGKKTSQKSANPKSSSVLQTSKLVSVTTHDEDIELEDKSILLTAQRKHFTNFSFGHKKSKPFRSNAPSHNYAKQLTAKSEVTSNKPQSGLDNANLVDELMESLPQ